MRFVEPDVVMLLRMQKERLAGMKIDLPDYIARYQMTAARLKAAKKDAIVMHPGQSFGAWN